jgi:hypothetical protein
MNYQNKIVKYKLKKNKIIQQINLLLNNKIKQNELYLSNSINNYLNEILKNSKSNLIHCIIITGIFGCGKTTLINYIKQSKKINNCEYIFTNTIMPISNIITEINNKVNNLNNVPFAIIIEIDLFNVNELLNQLNTNIQSNVNYHLWKLEPSNKIMYKYKIINKIFNIINEKKNINEFLNFIDYIDNSILPDKNISKKFMDHYLTNIKLERNKILYENNFDFVDEIVQILYGQSIITNIINFNFIGYSFINI